MIDWLKKTRQRQQQTRTVSLQQCVIELGGEQLPYRLRRSGRRSIAMHVDENGVRVLAPAAMSDEAVEAFIRGHAQWLRRRVAQWRQRLVECRLPVQSGALVPVLGGEYCIRIGREYRRAQWAEDGQRELRMPPVRSPANTVERLLRQRAREHFRERVAFFCERLDIEPPPVSLSSARTRWGSCSTRSGIRLNWRLIHLPAELIDYVAAHEVAHLVHMDHSPRFWAVVERLYPDWRRARGALKEQCARLPRFVCPSEG